MQTVLNRLKTGRRGNIVIDTTSSVIYTDNVICAELQKYSLVINIKISPEMQDVMFEKFFQHPKPIIWGENYHKLPGESNEAALKRCYPGLIDYRSRLYQHYADVVIPHVFLDENITGERLLSHIQSYL